MPALESALNQLDLLISQAAHHDTVSKNCAAITDLLAKSLAPLEGEWIWYEDEFTKSFNAKWTSQREFMQSAVPLLLVVSIHWLKLAKQFDASVNTKLVQSLMCYAINDGTYPWTLSNAHPGNEKLAKAVLQAVQPFCEDSSFRSILFQIIKPVFVKHSTHHSVSAAGRKLMTPESYSSNFTFSYLPEQDSKRSASHSWRTQHQYCLTLFEIFIAHSTSSELQENWAFIVPCVLNIIDDHNPGIKRKGGDLVDKVANNTSASFFKQTGVAQVFWSALEPTLAYLPPSTPANVSIPLTTSSYKAMMALSYLSKENPHQLHHKYFLEGVLTGISHAHNHTGALVNFITISTDLVSNHMKTYTTPHLKSLVAIVTGTLCDPFVTFSPKLVIATCELAEAIIKACWFKIIEYRYDLLRGLVTLSKRIAGDSEQDAQLDQTESQLLRTHARTVLTLLNQAVELNADSKDKVAGIENFPNELQALQTKEPAFAASQQ